MRTQRGGVITGWLVQLVIMFALAGLVLFEIGAVAIAKIGVDGTTQTAAQDAARMYGRSMNLDEACREAETKAKQGGGTLIACTISADGTALTVTVERIAKTLFIQKIGALAKHRIARSTHAVKPT